MIYVSSSCIGVETIRESVTTLAETGFKNIELSGGTEYYPGYEDNLLDLKEIYGLNYLVHNYFPPPKESFVLNLASLNDDIYKKSIELCKKAIRLSKKLGGRKYGVHAGYLIDFNPNEAGKKISKNPLSDRTRSIERFCEAYSTLNYESSNDVSIYIENNVLSITNAKTFAGNNPFLITDYKGYLELKELLDFNFLLDVAHLKVSSNSLTLDFENELSNLLPLADYIHLSENDGMHDQNRSFSKESILLNRLKKYNFKNKTITLEVYSDIKKVKESYNVLYKGLNI